MKKPNITEGEWYFEKGENFAPHWIYSKRGKDRIGIAQPHYCEKEEFHANAKAISAVPDMIDALVLAYKSIQNLEEQNNFFIPAKSDIEAALEKAGVEL